MNKQNFLAIDLGATSGRAIVATFDEGGFSMREIHRFPNAVMELQGKYYWNIFGLYEHIKKALVICGQESVELTSIGIDTWGVDFGYIGKDGSILSMPRAYRDPYTDGAPENYFENVAPRSEVYGATGIQIMNFNSLFQLYAAKKENFEPLNAAESILFIPDLLSYMLTGEMVCEYTAASTSQILNPATKSFENSLLEKIGVKPSLLKALVEPGQKVGTLTAALAEECGVAQVPVVTVAGHDTASAIVAVPAANKNFAYLSSGTWSLMGIETEEPIINDASFENNFTNEGGIEGTTRFLKNITGMWILEQCRKEWSRQGKEYSYPQIVEMAESAKAFSSIINPDDARFANPESMLASISEYCTEHNQAAPATDSEIVWCIFNSLANRYRDVLAILQEMAPFKIETLHVIGGGAQNALLNQLTADAIGLPVVAGPSEATAIGNIMVQAKACGLYADRWEMRKAISETIKVETFYPRN